MLCHHQPVSYQELSLEKPEKVIGKNTIDCMKSGAVYGSASMIDGLADRIEDELGEKVTYHCNRWQC